MVRLSLAVLGCAPVFRGPAAHICTEHPSYAGVHSHTYTPSIHIHALYPVHVLTSPLPYLYPYCLPLLRHFSPLNAAVKCNSDPRVLRELHALSSGFDCASQAEMEAVLALGEEEGARCVNASEDIVFANPVKSPKQLSYAERAGVGMVTFDNADELRKIKALHPGASVILRICPETDDVARCPMGSKYGCPMDRVPELLRLASALELDVAGVSYHVGSGCYEVGAFGDAVALARG